MANIIHSSMGTTQYIPLWEGQHFNEVRTRKLTTELRKWRQVAGSRLGYQQMYQVDYSNDDITQWKTTTMKEMIHLLVKAAALQEAHMLDNTQQRMTDFSDPIDFDSIEDDV